MAWLSPQINREMGALWSPVCRSSGSSGQGIFHFQFVDELHVVLGLRVNHGARGKPLREAVSGGDDDSSDANGGRGRCANVSTARLVPHTVRFRKGVSTNRQDRLARTMALAISVKRYQSVSGSSAQARLKANRGQCHR